MKTREQKGLEIAAVNKLVRKGNCWLVPSQAGNGNRYRVNLKKQHCTCPDHERREVKCKHLYAVEFTVKRETAPDGTTTVTKTMKVTYAQDWPAYNAAQSEEKDRFTVLLADLCKSIPQPEQGNGRPRLPLSDMTFACAFKVYSGFSSRRFTSDLKNAHTSGFVSRTPHFNSVSNYLADAAMTPILKELISLSSLPLKAVETDFAVDSSGFSTCRFVRWYNKKYGRTLDNREWVKVHLMVGVQTKIVTSAEVSGWAAHDSPFFTPLVDATAKNFRIAEVSADKAYLGHKNLATVEQAGAVPFIMFKKNTLIPTGDSLWARMYHFYAYNRETFLAHYHKRSNVETAMSMIKGKFGDAVRSKSTIAQANEVLCKVLCHNICVLIHSIHALDIEPTFHLAAS